MDHAGKYFTNEGMLNGADKNFYLSKISQNPQQMATETPLLGHNSTFVPECRFATTAAPTRNRAGEHIRATRLRSRRTCDTRTLGTVRLRWWQ